MTQRKIIVIGAGPAGLMAGGRAAEAGADTLILEKMKQPGRKLGITGKGRCNITNSSDVTDFIAHFGKTGPFLRQSFSRFFNIDLMEFLTNLGLELVTERGGRVFPASGKATDVVKSLQKWAAKCGAEFKFSSPVEKLLIKDGSVKGVISNNRKFPCDAVILATGGASYPRTGSTGDGYSLAATAGHTVIPIRPALIPLVTSGDEAGRMEGLNLRNIKARMFVDGKKRKEEFGELLFTSFGLSGPVILTLSGEVVDALQLGKKVVISLDLKPALDEKKLDARLLRDISSRGKEELISLLRGLLPREMVPICLNQTRIPPERKACTLSVKERRRLRTWLKDFRLEVTQARPISEAIVTAGGIHTKEIHPKTMESKLIKGLFITGELLDIHADTGGYNLQAAFSTGWIAGQAAARE
jgi:predicted Rossmann fold flavoprotein